VGRRVLLDPRLALLARIEDAAGRGIERALRVVADDRGLLVDTFSGAREPLVAKFLYPLRDQLVLALGEFDERAALGVDALPEIVHRDARPFRLFGPRGELIPLVLEVERRPDGRLVLEVIADALQRLV